MATNTHIPHSIAHIIDMLDAGGAEHMVVTLANIFAGHGHRVKVITLTLPGPLSQQLNKKVEQYNLQRGFKFNPVNMYKLLKQVQGFDVVHIHSFYNLRYFWLAKLLFGFNKPVFYHEHFGFRGQQKPSFWHRYILPKTIFISTAANISQWAVQDVHVAANRVFTLQNIVIKQTAPALQKVNDDIIKLVLVSNIRREKNIEFGIELLQYLNSINPKYHLTIIGKLYQQDYYSLLKDVISKTGTVSSITFIHNADSVQQLLPQFDIGLHTSSSESGPLAVIEYIAQGLPFVAYNTGEVITAVKQELDECIATSFNIQEWADKIKNLQAGDLQVLQQKLNLSFNRHFSQGSYYRQCLDIYNKGLII